MLPVPDLSGMAWWALERHVVVPGTRGSIRTGEVAHSVPRGEIARIVTELIPDRCPRNMDVTK